LISLGSTKNGRWQNLLDIGIASSSPTSSTRVMIKNKSKHKWSFMYISLAFLCLIFVKSCRNYFFMNFQNRIKFECMTLEYT
jgi:hypothetical protein